MKIFGLSDIGKVRKANEDSFGIFTIASNATLAVVCDGMGGLDCGDVASKTALDAFVSTVGRLCSMHIDEKDILTLSPCEADLIMSNSVTVANNRVIAKQQEHEDSAGMGTTLVAALILNGGESISWANIGDSRLYTADKRDILQVSKDHSYVQHLIDIGEMTLEEAKKSKKRNLITKAIGIDTECSPDVDTFPLSKEEITMTKILICSDGFSGALDEEAFYPIVMKDELSVEKRVEKLVALAKKKDGSDNITLILADLAGGEK